MDRPIINTWDQLCAAGGDRIALIYHGHDPNPLSCRVPKWAVLRIVNGREVKTDPGGWYGDNGMKTFTVHHPLRQHKMPALEGVIAWVREQFGPRAFTRNRMGDFVEVEVNAKFPIPPRKRV